VRRTLLGDERTAAAARVGRLTALHGLRTTKVRLQWVEEVQAQLEDDS
jgi:hypothetical protein